MDNPTLMENIPNYLLFKTYASMKEYEYEDDPRKIDDEKFVVCCCSNHKILRTSINAHKKSHTHRSFLKPYFPSPYLM